MSADDDRDAPDGQDFRRLPPGVRLEDTVAGQDPDPVPDADDVRNADQHRALRDD